MVSTELRQLALLVAVTVYSHYGYRRFYAPQVHLVCDLPCLVSVGQEGIRDGGDPSTIPKQTRQQGTNEWTRSHAKMQHWSSVRSDFFKASPELSAQRNHYHGLVSDSTPPSPRKIVHWPRKSQRNDAMNQVDPAYRLINRVLDYSDSIRDFELTLLSENDSTRPYKVPFFAIANSPDGHRISISGGPTLSEITAGIGWYLRNIVNATSLDIWPPMKITNVNTSSQDWPKKIGSDKVIVKHRKVKFSHLMNVCTHSYSLVWYDAHEWERFIDWMALSGINMMLALTGQEWIQYKLFRKLGLNDTDIRHWFNGPAFLTWSRGQNEYGSNIAGPLPLSWMKSQWSLQRTVILPRIRELDIIGQLPAFQGNVPIQLKSIYQDSNITEEGATGWMDSLDPLFGNVARLWMETMIKDFGTDHWYQLDGYFNGGTAPWLIPKSEDKHDHDNLSKIQADHDEAWYQRGVAAFQGLNATDPEAIWSFQGFAFVGWDNDQQASYLKGFVDSVPHKDRLVIMDMSYDLQHPEWAKWNQSAFFGASFIWTTLHNFGGTDGIRGDMRKINHMPFDALNLPKPAHPIGLGATPEGITQNPAYYAFLYEQAFEDKPQAALTDYVIAMAHRRYGIDPQDDWQEEIVQSWSLLLNSLYSTDRSVQDGTGVAHWNNRRISDGSSLFEKDRYTPTAMLCQVFTAWEYLVKAATKSKQDNGRWHTSSSFRYDVINLGREVLAQLSTPVALNFSESIAADPIHPDAVTQSGNFYQSLLLDLDSLVGTEKSFHLSRWLRSARQWGSSTDDCILPAETINNESNKTRCEVFYEWNARSQVTTWNPTLANATSIPGGPIDYAAKHWHGLIREYYVKRIALVQNQALEDAVKHQTLNQTKVDWLLAQHAYEWTLLESFKSHIDDHQVTVDRSMGDYIDVSRTMLQKYQMWFRGSCPAQEFLGMNKGSVKR